jgi:hypothetical protein
MNRDLVAISQDTPLRVAAELFFQRHIGEAAVVGAAGQCVGLLSATEGSCPRQELRPMTGGRHTAVCLLRDGPVSDLAALAPRPYSGGRLKRD